MMYKCFSDAMGNMPCDNGCLCDKCNYMDVEVIDCSIDFDEEEEEEE